MSKPAPGRLQPARLRSRGCCSSAFTPGAVKYLANTCDKQKPRVLTSAWETVTLEGRNVPRLDTFAGCPILLSPEGEE